MKVLGDDYNDVNDRIVISNERASIYSMSPKDKTNMTDDELYKYIERLSQEDKQKAFSDISIKTQLILSKNKYHFIWTIQNLDDKSFNILMDDDGIDVLLASKRTESFLNAIITAPTNSKNNVFKNTKIIDALIKKKQNLFYLLSSLNDDTLLTILDYLKVKNLNDFYYALSYMPSSVLVKWLNDNNFLVEQLFMSNDFNFLKIHNRELLSELLKMKTVQNYLLTIDVYKLIEIFSNQVTLPEELKNNSIFTSKICSINPATFYRRVVTSLTVNNDLDFIEKLELNRKAFSDELIIMCNEKETLSDKEKDEVIELVIDTFFKDNYNNISINLEEMLSFIKQIADEIINDELLVIYNLVNNFKNLNAYDVIKVYNLMDKKNIDFSYKFAEDYMACRDKSIELIKNSLFIPAKKTSKINGVDVYELNGEPFNLLVHCTKKIRNNLSIPFYTKFDGQFNGKNATSLSLISNRLLKTFKNPTEYLTFGFKDINEKQIAHMYTSDSYSSSYNTSGLVSSRVTSFNTPDNLIEKTSGYNEIVYLNKNKSKIFEKDVLNNLDFLKPSYLICYDIIKEFDYHVAKIEAIPIILIKTKNYNNRVEPSTIFHDKPKEYRWVNLFSLFYLQKKEVSNLNFKINYLKHFINIFWHIIVYNSIYYFVFFFLWYFLTS